MTSRWGEFFPIPLVGAAVLLVVLIFLTPNLISASGGPAAGSIEAQAELVVDRTSAGTVTNLYVHGLSDVRYASITIQIATKVSWPAPASIPKSAWTNVTTLNETLALLGSTTADPFAVNVTAVYVDSTFTSYWYLGEFVMEISGGTLSVTPLLPGAGSVAPTPVTALPLILLLSGSASGVAS